MTSIYSQSTYAWSPGPHLNPTSSWVSNKCTLMHRSTWCTLYSWWPSELVLMSLRLSVRANHIALYCTVPYVRAGVTKARREGARVHAVDGERTVRACALLFCSLSHSSCLLPRFSFARLSPLLFSRCSLTSTSDERQIQSGDHTKSPYAYLQRR